MAPEIPKHIFDKFDDVCRVIIDNPTENICKYSLEEMKEKFFQMFFWLGNNEKLYSLDGNHFSVFNFKFENERSLLIFFAIPIDSKVNSKNLSERVMFLIKLVEDYFTTVDFTEYVDLQEEKFGYLFFVKKIKEK